MTDDVLGHVCSFYKSVLSFTFCQLLWFSIESYHFSNHSEEQLILFRSHCTLLGQVKDSTFMLHLTKASCSFRSRRSPVGIRRAALVTHARVM